MTGEHRAYDRGFIRRELGYVLAALSLAILATAAGVYLHYSSVVDAPVLSSGETETLVIPQNTAWPGVVDRLEASGLVDHRWYFELWARRRGLPRSAKAGRYEIDGPVGWRELADLLREGGKAEGVKLTVPEGWTIFHVADRVERLGLGDREQLLKLARSSELLNELSIEGESVEGYLYPETYEFSAEAGAEQVIRRMVGKWREVWRKIAAAHQGALDELKETYDFDRHDIVTLASLVEAETPVREERPVVARVFLNRIDEGMRLQTDPSCVYGAETYLKTPTPELCNDPANRYSTYVIDGLPPGPIANPSRESLEAAVDPSDAEDAKEYLYFVARQDGTGRHVFSRTYREHRRAIRKYLK